MKPSDVNLDTPTPLVGALGRAELEWAAGLLVLACQDKGAWVACTELDIHAAAERSPCRWIRAIGVVVHPDFRGLAHRGWVSLTEEGEPRIAFTPAGLAKLEASRAVIKREEAEHDLR